MERELSSGTNNTAIVSDAAARRPDADGHYFCAVNGITVKFKDAVQRGEHILKKAEFEPPDDYVLIQLQNHASRSIEFDETVDLTAPGTETFRAFKSDRIFRYTLNGHGYEWGESKISVVDIREIGSVHADEVVVLEKDGEDIDFPADAVVDLGEAGTEHLHTEKKLITVYFENKPREIKRGVYTTEELKSMFDVQAGYILEYIAHNGELTPLKPGQKLRVKDQMKFFEQVPCGASS